ncbi:MAG TPA: murein biosynthesis integral membrane protein MurJ [Thermodesulfobacteriota bacterium]|nr:murein biosynthesis integral membrane protein MurJ [Thermodesulfobacteriota bacterium]
MIEAKNITKAASIVGSATFLSRILGYIRDAVIAAYFGAGASADVFFIAYRIPNFFRRIVGEGALTVSFIPVFTEELSLGSRERAKRLASRAFTFFTIILAALTIAGVLFAPQIVEITAPGFANIPNKLPIAISLTRWMFPFLFFICLVALGMGVLNSLKHFAAPALSPVWFNLSIIGSTLFLIPFFKEAVYALAFGVVFGGALQFLYQLPYLKRYDMLPRPDFNFNDPAIRKIVFLMLPAALAAGVDQINILIVSRFASHLKEGSISYLYYADRIVELPMGVFVIAVATAVFPSMSEYAVKQDWPGFKESLSFAIRLVTFITVPATVGLIALGGPIVSMLFQRGEFSHEATKGTVYALWFFSVGLVAFGGRRILLSAFYSLKDTLTPVLVGCVAVAANIIFCFLLIGPLQHGGLALATSLSAIINLFLLFFILRKRLGRIGGRKIFASAVKAAISSLLMGAGVYGISILIDWSHGGITMLKLAVLVLAIGFGVTSYLLFARLFKSPEMAFLTGMVMERLGKKKEN